MNSSLLYEMFGGRGTKLDPRYEAFAIWEAALDATFKDPVQSDAITRDGHLLYVLSSLPVEMSWRSLVGLRMFLIDAEMMHVALPPQQRAALLPAICMSLAIWDRSLNSAEAWESFFVPVDDAAVSEIFVGWTEEQLPDLRFRDTLALLNAAQRGCIADFVAWHFRRRVETHPDVRAAQKALERLVAIWRGGE